MQDYDPHWSVSAVLDHFADVASAAMILTLCLEQIAEQPPDLLPRLQWLITCLQMQMENAAEDGTWNTERLRTYLDALVSSDAGGGDPLAED